MHRLTNHTEHGDELSVQVTHFQRLPRRRHFSIERLFADVRSGLPPSITCRVAVSHFESRGLFKRICNAVAARGMQTQVNHITGDIHYVALLMRPEKTILTIHDCVSLTIHPGLKRTLIRLLWYEWPARRAFVITTVSESSKREILTHTHCPAEKIRVIPNCISREFQPSPKPFNAECPLVLQIGTAPTKNIERLVAALSGLRCRLRIVGTPNDAQWAAIRDSGVDCSVVERLTAEEIVQAYKDADIVALVSTYEGFGLPIAEANAVGRPVIAGNVYSMPEVAADAASLVDPYDVKAIRAAFVKVISDSAYRERLIDAGYSNARRFDGRVVARQYAELYASVARGDCSLREPPCRNRHDEYRGGIGD
jgi:glycosyltransferase involved in cell wall biosynthesis